MLLVIDIGNTNIDIGVFNDELLLHRKIPTVIQADEAFYRAQLRTILNPYLESGTLRGGAVGSVVAALGETLAAAARPLCRDKILPVEATWNLGLKIDYDHPARIGIDRLLATAAAFHRIPTGHGLLVADAGTAITVDAVDPDGIFLGGLILPGLQLGLQALHRSASLLPAIELNAQVPLLGKNTGACMQAGALHGSAALLDGLYGRIAAQLDCPLEGFLTGGDSELLQPHVRHFPHVNPALVLEGLRLAYRRRLDPPY